MRYERFDPPDYARCAALARLQAGRRPARPPAGRGGTGNTTDEAQRAMADLIRKVRQQAEVMAKRAAET
jgi:hypothetical protein